MLQRTQVSLRSSNYRQRAMEAPHRWWRATYLRPESVYQGGPLLNKDPEEYPNNWDWRHGPAWKDRLNKRGLYRTWPWVSIHDDPVGDAVKKQSHIAAPFSMRDAASVGAPITFDPFSAVGRDYKTPSSVPVTQVVPFLLPHVSRTWREPQVKSYVNLVSKQWPTVHSVSANADALRDWNSRTASVPSRFVDYLVMLCNDMVELELKKANRLTMHERGVLRTNNMQRYYAMPYTVGPAMPTTLAQPEGKQPKGEFTYMFRVSVRMDPAVSTNIDSLERRNKMPI